MTEIHTSLGTLAQAEAALQRLAAQRLPVKAAYHLAKLCTLVRTELKVFEEQRLAIVKELGVAGPAALGQESWQVAPDRMPDFTARITELVAIPVTIAWGPFDLSPLAIDITAEDLLALGPLVTLTTEAETQA